MKAVKEQLTVEYLRKLRSENCFPIVNRGRLWYDTLTMEQLSELTIWYRKWLDVTITKIIPNSPNWLNDKVKEEEILL